ncbi:MAG: hypothetical protein CVU47_06380 [Chloroflexi bacterium HGW-Chloroflexi-9]|nr:MAG: hypothetical protein CVU47_06380 [Chloroflexi bacterium HGW-Chloroflexi-9]
MDLQTVVDQAHTAYADGRAVQPRANRRGELVVADFWTQMLLDGRIYHVQVGTEDAPVDSTAAIDDELVWALVDQNAGNAMVPFAASVRIANWTTATLVGSMLEADLAKKRYSSGGTAFTPRCLRGDTPNTFDGAAYVGTDVTALAKSAVPDSVEFHRGPLVEDAQATPDAAAANVALEYSARKDALVAVVGVGSLLLHHGATTADVKSYGFLQFVQIDRSKFV